MQPFLRRISRLKKGLGTMLRLEVTNKVIRASGRTSRFLLLLTVLVSNAGWTSLVFGYQQPPVNPVTPSKPTTNAQAPDKSQDAAKPPAPAPNATAELEKGDKAGGKKKDAGTAEAERARLERERQIREHALYIAGSVLESNDLTDKVEAAGMK